MIKDYFKTIIKNNENWEVLDFDKIRSLPYHVFLIMSERGLLGKTYGSIELILKRWQENNEKSVFLYNTKAQWQSTSSRFIFNNQVDNPIKWQNIKATKKGLWDGKVLFCFFVSLLTSSKLKGARNYQIKNIVYDEFNESTLLLQKGKQTALFESLIHTFSDPHSKSQELKVFIFGNQKTLANQFLNDLGIVKISQELEIVKNLIWFFCPMKNKSEMKRISKNNWLYEFSELVDRVNVSFFNQNISDNFEGIFTNDELDGFLLKADQGHYFYSEGKFFETWTDNQILYFSPIKRKPILGEIFCAKNKDIDHGIVLNSYLIVRWRNFACQRILRFKDYNTKISILNVLSA